MFELHSRRARQDGNYPPAPAKETFSPRLRDALFLTIRDCIGRYDDSLNYIQGPFGGNRLWDYFDRTMFLHSNTYHAFQFLRGSNSSQRVYQYFKQSWDRDVLDALDLGVAIIHSNADNMHAAEGEYELRRFGVSLNAATALQRMDEMLRAEGTMYRIVQHQVVFSTDDFTHEESIVPALQVLAEPGFENALREFHCALSDYRGGDFAGAMTNANHAFESTMKVISSKMGWPYSENATASKLVGVMISNGLFQPMRESALNGLRTMLESDLPTLRNRTPSAGHGAGTRDAHVPEPLAIYAITVAAANIRLLVEEWRKLNT